MTLLTASAGALLSSCTYDPYRYGSNSSVSSTVGYSSNGHLSSSIFIRTSNSRWGYDPHCHSYYDFTRQCYYDPYLNGYYPRGYRPPIIVGVPHPRGWRPGVPTCPPPTHVRDYNIRDYRNRHQQYCNLNQPWARDLRTRTTSTRNHSDWNNGNWNNGNPHSSHPSTQSNSIWNRTNPGVTQSRNSNWDQGNRQNPSINRNDRGMTGNPCIQPDNFNGNSARNNNHGSSHSNPGMSSNRAPSTPNMTNPGVSRPQSNPGMRQDNAAPRNIPNDAVTQASGENHKGKIR